MCVLVRMYVCIDSGIAMVVEAMANWRLEAVCMYVCLYVYVCIHV